jgi:hypothetical protein
VYRFDARGAFLPKFLGAIIVLFCAILVATYFISKQANPIMLDEKGNLRDSHAAVHK